MESSGICPAKITPEKILNVQGYVAEGESVE
jgi:hypothetical protein